MKKSSYFILILMLIFIPINTYAANDISISCDKTKLNKNEEVNCLVSVNNLNFIVTDITGQIQMGENLSLVSSSYDGDQWVSLASSFTVADLDLIRKEISEKSSLTIASFKVKASSVASGTSSITFKNIGIGNDSYQSVPIAEKTIPITFNSSVNTLKSLSVSGAEITFSPDKTSYSLIVNQPSVSITAIPTHTGAKVSGSGTKNLGYGNNTINILVTAEDGSNKTYVLNIERPDNRSKNNNLKNLSLSKGNLNFNKSTTTYNVDVSADVDSVVVKAEVEDSKATFVEGFGGRTIKLAYGKNSIQVKVKSENETIKIYTININRKDDRSKNNNLKSIILSNGKIDFNKEVTEYTVNVPFEIESMEIEATAEDLKSKIEVIEPETFIVGENNYTIKVIAENGDIKEYKIKVIKDEKIIITNSNKLKNLEVEGHELDFDPEVYSYKIKTNNSKFNIIVELNDLESTYKINGNDNLKDGSIVKLTVISQSGIKNEYKIDYYT